MTLMDLARELGYSTHAYLSEIEQGKKRPTVEFAVKASIYFAVSLDVLLRDDFDLPQEPISTDNHSSSDAEDSVCRSRA